MHKDILGKLDVDKLMLKVISKMDSHCLIFGDKHVVTVHPIARVVSTTPKPLSVLLSVSVSALF